MSQAPHLVEYVLGTLPADEARALEAQLDAQPELRDELDAIAEALTGFALAQAPPEAPPDALKDRLLASTGDGVERFLPMLDRFAQLVDLGLEAARARLAIALDPDAWLDVPIPHVRLIHFDGGPATVGADVGFVHLEAGMPFPWHTHHGSERALVLQGGYIDSDGSTLRAGQIAEGEPGERHMFTALPDEDLIYAVVVFGVEFDDPVDIH